MKKRIFITKLVFLLVIAASCTVKLAPDYEQGIVDGLNSTNFKIMKFMASVSDGTEKNSFSDRENTYNELIGSLDALELQAKARPVPDTKVTEKINKALEDRGVPVAEGAGLPSATAISKISETLSKMKEVDKKQGVTSLEVKAFKGQMTIFMDQALTYESFLKR